MEFSNAKKGVGLIFTAVILEIVSEILVGVGLAVGAGGLNWQAVSFLVIILIAAVVGIVAFIQDMRGLIWARKDEPCFNYALWLVIFSIVLSLVSGVFRTNGSSIGTTICISLSSLFECVVTVLICTGISNIYLKKGNAARSKEGFNTGMIFVIVYAIAKALEILVTSNYAYIWGSTIMIILAVVEVVLVLVAFIKFVLYLYRAKNEL